MRVTSKLFPREQVSLVIIREIQVFDTTYRNIPAVEAVWENVGLGLLRHMDITIDFPNNKVYTPDPPKPGIDWFPSDASGLRIVRHEDGIVRVRRIVDESSAASANVKVGDELMALDGKPAADFSGYEIEEKLSQAGTTIRLELKRDGKPLTVSLPLVRDFEYPPKWPDRSAEDDEFLKSLDKD